MHTLTLKKTHTLADFALVLLASFIICVSGQITIPLWFTPVPIVIQNAVVFLMAALLGPRRGAAATFAFLTQGALGLPVFANGSGGYYCFFGPTGGYLIGYLIAAFFAGMIAERKRTIGNALAALMIGNVIVLSLGAGYLATFVGIKKAFLLGILPFIGGDVLKTLISLKIIQWLRWNK